MLKKIEVAVALLSLVVIYAIYDAWDPTRVNTHPIYSGFVTGAGFLAAMGLLLLLAKKQS